MNQILVTKKLYITPELKRKKKVYKFNFFLSVFLICILISFCIYAEYDRNKSEEVSQKILADLQETTDTTVAKNNVMIVVLDEEEESAEIVDTQSTVQTSATTTKKTSQGYEYSTIATINIPKINVQYAIIDGKTDSEEDTEELLKISPVKFWGANPNEVGNFCIVGHNYRNTKFFSKVPTLQVGDIIEITDLSNNKVSYRVYNNYQVDPKDVSCTTQLTNGNKEVTLITCTDDSKMRVVVKAREVK